MNKLFAALALTLFATLAPAQGSALPKVDAEVRRVDTANHRITLRHGDIPNVNMGAMTMVFPVKDPLLLKDVKAGDKVRFTADTVNGDITVMSLEPVRP